MLTVHLTLGSGGGGGGGGGNGGGGGGGDGGNVVVACSALRHAYREVLAGAGDGGGITVHFLHLAVRTRKR